MWDELGTKPLERQAVNRCYSGRVPTMRTAALAVVGLAVATLTGLAQEPVFRAGVDLVTVDAIVVDSDGRPVTGLTADDFTITVEGKPR